MHIFCLLVTCALAAMSITEKTTQSDWKSFIVWVALASVLMLANLNAIGPRIHTVERELRLQHDMLSSQASAQIELLRKVHENRGTILDILSKLDIMVRKTKQRSKSMPLFENKTPQYTIKTCHSYH
jgi:hypothetical protein